MTILNINRRLTETQEQKITARLQATDARLYCGHGAYPGDPSFIALSERDVPASIRDRYYDLAVAAVGSL
jgi:hypothetical protein